MSPWDLMVTGFTTGVKPPRAAPGVDEHNSQCKTGPAATGFEHRTETPRTHWLAPEPRHLMVTGFTTGVKPASSSDARASQEEELKKKKEKQKKAYLIRRKVELKAQGFSGGRCNKDGQVVQ